MATDKPNNKQDEDFILQHQRKRRRRKISLAIESIVTIIIALVFMFVYAELTRNEYNEYKEKTNVDYRVHLKPNEFYEDEYVDEATNVVASLIDNIEAEFKYNLDLENDQEYTYNYKILAKTSVKEKSQSNPIYETTDEILNKENLEGSSKKLEIIEKVNINYDEYNQKISNFIKAYGLDNTTSTVEFSMYVDVINKYDGERINKENKVITLDIPLTTKTVDISIKSNIIEDKGQILSKKSEYEDLNYMMIIGTIILIIGFINIARLVKYMLDTRSAETMYEQELRNILFNYKSYLQTVNNEVDIQNYKVIYIKTFNEILAMRETIQAPILMYTDANEMRTTFTIIKDGNAYVNILGAKEIRNELRAKSAEKKAKEGKRTK